MDLDKFLIGVLSGIIIIYIIGIFKVTDFLRKK